MLTLLLVLVSVFAYFAVGAVLARVCAGPVYRRQWRWNVKNYSHSMAQKDALNETRAKLVTIGALWPFVLPGYFGYVVARRVDGWVLRPALHEQNRPSELRADARAWDEKAHDGSDEERSMARELAKMCREQADEMEARR